jgi:hypothetical protein
MAPDPDLAMLLERRLAPFILSLLRGPARAIAIASGLRPGGRGPPGFLKPGRVCPETSAVPGLSARSAASARVSTACHPRRAGRSGVRSLRSDPARRRAMRRKPPDLPPFPGRLRGRSFVTIRRAPRLRPGIVSALIRDPASSCRIRPEEGRLWKGGRVVKSTRL